MATSADQLAEETNLYGLQLSYALCRKYPQLNWVEKYALADRAYLVSELTGMHAGLMGLDFFWTYQADINIYVRLLASGVPFSSMIRLKSGTKHVVCVVGVSTTKKQLYVHDPLGNYHTDYEDYNGANIPFSYTLFQKIGVGDPLCAFCNSPPQMRKTMRSVLRDVKHFEFMTEEVLDELRVVQGTHRSRFITRDLMGFAL